MGLRQRLGQWGVPVPEIRVQTQAGASSMADLLHYWLLTPSPQSRVYFRVWRMASCPICEGCIDKGRARKLLEKVIHLRKSEALFI